MTTMAAEQLDGTVITVEEAGDLVTVTAQVPGHSESVTLVLDLAGQGTLLAILMLRVARAERVRLERVVASYAP